MKDAVKGIIKGSKGKLIKRLLIIGGSIVGAALLAKAVKPHNEEEELETIEFDSDEETEDADSEESEEK